MSPPSIGKPRIPFVPKLDADALIGELRARLSLIEAGIAKALRERREPVPQEWEAHDHGGLRHEHFVVPGEEHAHGG